MLIIFCIVSIGVFTYWFIQDQQISQRERERFSRTYRSSFLGYQSKTKEEGEKFDAWFDMIGRFVSLKNNTKNSPANTDGKVNAYLLQKEMNTKLRAAGLETFSEQGKFFFFQIFCYLSWPFICITAWMYLSRYYAVVTSFFGFGLVILLPHFWLKWKTHQRSENIQRELPLFVDLLNLATSAGWDIASALEKVIDALVPEFPKHPLFRELKRARWLVSSGYTWQESLERAALRLRDDSVTRTTKALTIAIEQGGDRSLQLSGIAEDAERNYYAVVDKRLASIPLQALMITIVLFLMYFTILLAPAAVGVSDVSSFL